MHETRNTHLSKQFFRKRAGKAWRRDFAALVQMNYHGLSNFDVPEVFRKMKRNILIVVGGIILLVALLVWQLFGNLDKIVAGIIEDTGSEVLKTKVSVYGVAIDLKAGKVGIAGLTVANPAGYSNANLFEMSGIEVDLDLGSVTEDVLVIEAIRVDNPKIVFEGDAGGGSNMQTLLDNIDSAPAGDSSADQGDAKKIIIERFAFSGGKVKASTELKPGEVMDLRLPAIQMNGIGKAEGGVTADEVAKQISSKLVSAVIKEAAKEGVSKAIEKKAKGLLDKIKGNN